MARSGEPSYRAKRPRPPCSAIVYGENKEEFGLYDDNNNDNDNDNDVNDDDDEEEEEEETLDKWEGVSHWRGSLGSSRPS